MRTSTTFALMTPNEGQKETYTATIANRLITLCKENKFIQAQQELYDEQIISVETDGSKTLGAANMLDKEQKFLDSIEKIHRTGFSEPIIARDYFSVKLSMEIEFKNNMHRSIEEICVYKTAGGKIVFEQFFRS